MPTIEFQLHEDTLQVRTHLHDSFPGFRFHDGFSRQDSESGWTQEKACDADMTPAEVEAQKSEIIAGHKQYWNNLATTCKDSRVVIGGSHYVWHTLGTGSGFGGASFKVCWLDADKEPLICNLSAQGRVPAYMRSEIPDNAASVAEVGVSDAS